MDTCDVVVHKCALFEVEPNDVECMSLNHQLGILAVARRSASRDREHDTLLEYWNVIGDPTFHVKTRPLSRNGVESITWVDCALLSAHIDGSVIIHSLHTPQTVRSQLCPSPIWCLTPIAGHSFAAGTDSGSVLLLLLNENKVEITRTINTGFGCRILSLASNGSVIASGSIDQISIIGIEKAKILHTLKVPRTEKRKPTIIWSLAFVSETLVSGDSRGCVSFWSVENGALYQTFESHQADVLALVASGQFVYAAGVDPSIMRFHRDKKRNNTYRIDHRWRMHSNDVRALAVSGSRLISGGAQQEFFISTLDYQNIILRPPTFFYAPETNFILYQYTRHVVIWAPGTPKFDDYVGEEYLLDEEPVKLAHIESPNHEFIVSSAIKGSGNYVAISTTTALVVYEVSLATEERQGKSNRWTVCDVKECVRHNLSASAMIFNDDSLFFTTSDFTFCSLLLKQPSVINTIASRENAGEVVCLNVLSQKECCYFLFLTTRNEILYCDTAFKKLQRLDVYPHKAPFLDAQFVNSEFLFILCADRKRTVLECSLERMNKHVRLKGVDLSSKSSNFCTLSSEALELRAGDSVLGMHVAHNGTCFFTTRGHVRLLVPYEGRRAVLFAEEPHSSSTAVSDRCCRAQWIQDGCVLVNVPSICTEPSQGAFKLKRFGQN